MQHQGVLKPRPGASRNIDVGGAGTGPKSKNLRQDKTCAGMSGKISQVKSSQVKIQETARAGRCARLRALSALSSHVCPASCDRVVPSRM